MLTGTVLSNNLEELGDTVRPRRDAGTVPKKAGVVDERVGFGEHYPRPRFFVVGYVSDTQAIWIAKKTQF
jgi:hypothetical protein